MATKPIPSKRELASEAAPRQTDPMEVDFMGVIRGNDPLLRERGANIDAYLDLSRDGKVFASLNRRIGALVSRPWAVEPVREGDTASAEALSEILRRIPFDQLCRDLMGALIVGYAVVEVIWEVVGGKWLPARFPVCRPGRFVYVDGEGSSGPELRLLTTHDMLRGEALPACKFIVHRVNPRDDNPYGLGLGLNLFWPVFFKRRGIIAWAKFCDRFGTPTPWGRYPNGAAPKDKKTLSDALRAFSNDGYIMTPEGALIELLEAHGGGNITTQEALVKTMNSDIAEIILGQESGAEGNGGALAAAAKERADVRLDLVQADSDLLSETLNQTLIAWLCDFHGIGPCNVYRKIKEEVDLKAESETDVNVASLGFELSEEAARAKYGEGWSRRKTGPEPPAPEGEPPGTAAFSEAGTVDEATRDLARLTAAEAQPIIDDWIGRIAAIIKYYPDATPEDFQERLAQIYGDLPTGDLIELMAKAEIIAEYRGRRDVEAGR
ncbi:hypothetical protein AGMMS50256_31670 [Betaproteobacteria bacterium]|nr:hypothetical protein AGMMS50256_31670 [Betaproteobacteria bacterium]